MRTVWNGTVEKSIELFLSVWIFPESRRLQITEAALSGSLLTQLELQGQYEVLENLPAMEDPKRGGK